MIDAAVVSPCPSVIPNAILLVFLVAVCLYLVRAMLREAAQNGLTRKETGLVVSALKARADLWDEHARAEATPTLSQLHREQADQYRALAGKYRELAACLQEAQP